MIWSLCLSNAWTSTEVNPVDQLGTWTEDHRSPFYLLFSWLTTTFAHKWIIWYVCIMPLIHSLTSQYKRASARSLEWAVLQRQPADSSQWQVLSAVWAVGLFQLNAPLKSYSIGSRLTLSDSVKPAWAAKTHTHAHARTCTYTNNDKNKIHKLAQGTEVFHPDKLKVSS